MPSDSIEVVVIDYIPDSGLAAIAAVDPSVHLVDARGWFDDEIRSTWPEWSVRRYLAHRKSPTVLQDERDGVLASAEVILGGWPFPLDLRSRAPKLRWFHQRPAGASNLLRGDLWNSDVVATTSRAHGDTGPMAEYVLAAFAYFARGLHRAAVDRQRQEFEPQAYRPVLLAGKTACVVGVGGIGTAVGRLCAAAGMHVVGTRRDPPPGAPLPEGFDRVERSERMPALLSRSHFVAICCPWTRETTHLINAAALAALPAGAVLVNVARGEIVDEAALVDSLEAGRLRGVALDVYDGEFEHAPDARLWQNPRVLLTPHVSGGTDVPEHRGVELFCENLRAYLDGRALTNVIDWERGY